MLDSPNQSSSLYTIGHSDHELPRFLELLGLHEITAIADVRSSPYSGRFPQFDREVLAVALRAAGVKYVFLGTELGARRVEPECYIDDQARYELIAKTTSFRFGLRRVVEGMSDHRVALMCAEKDPITCHRAILVCRQLRAAKLAMRHVLADGTIESHAESELRLLKLFGLEEHHLFEDTAALVERAYELQAAKIAYKRQPVAAGPLEYGRIHGTDPIVHDWLYEEER
jgi:uncharacterized protein (DUF488 family)